ncbi:N-acetylglucosamine-6-phosphate deacetylase [Pseudoalteromonas fenneropenaei]|uniref:N-acetylgalactosamine-6-phosphate deacetylase n=1 Tax=Pseudoalteromonas fenneropenaei TaxID=1737459 RepID=A0ABV7CPM5_9GAMM
MSSFYLRPKRIITLDAILTGHAVLIAGERIAAITVQPDPSIEIIDLPELTLMPGMIDLHIHGREGADVMDAKPESLQRIACSLAKYGVTGFLATTVTADWQQTLAALRCVKQVMANPINEGARLLGAYSEGQFFSSRFKGAHNTHFFLPLEQQYFEQMLAAAGASLKVVALAPELENAQQIIRWLSEQGIKVLLGHCDSSYDTTCDALNAGACGGVHVFNGMRGLHHREPGTVGALLHRQEALVELIADGVHLHPAVVDLIYRLKGAEHMTLISDCVNAGGLVDGRYQLGEMAINVNNGIATTDEGSLAGSTLTLDKALRFLREQTEVSELDAVKMASLVPARFLGIAAQTGSICVGKFADLCALDSSGEVIATWVAGKQVYG